MTEVAHGIAAATRPQVDALAQRLLVLRSEIDAILAGLDAARTPAGIAETHASTPEAPLAAAAASEPVDDLRLISAIDDALAEDLDSLGVVAYAQIAAWSKRDVAHVSEALGLGRRIAKENWIEQAAVLAGGRMTAFAGRRLAFTSAPVCEAGRAGTHDAVAPETEAAVVAASAVTEDDRSRAAPAGPAEALAPDAAADLPVLSLHPYRGLPPFPAAIRRPSPRTASGDAALAIKLAACLMALVLAGLVMVDRDAWGSVPAQNPAPRPLQAQVSPGARHAPAHAPARSLLGVEGLLPADRP
jgi:predicted flap endonuclease-1-like 5' DNA nuclease